MQSTDLQSRNGGEFDPNVAHQIIRDTVLASMRFEGKLPSHFLGSGAAMNGTPPGCTCRGNIKAVDRSLGRVSSPRSG